MTQPTMKKKKIERKPKTTTKTNRNNLPLLVSLTSEPTNPTNTTMIKMEHFKDFIPKKKKMVIL